MRVQSRRLAAQVAEEKARCFGASDLDQAEAGTVEVLDRVHMGCRRERAVEAVGPRVVWALDASTDLALGVVDQARTAVAAGVEEDARNAVLAPQGKHAGLADLAHDVGARLSDEGRVAQAYPAAVEVVHLPGQDRRIREGRGRQHRSLRDRPGGELYGLGVERQRCAASGALWGQTPLFGSR